jgi:hypothetical protein
MSDMDIDYESLFRMIKKIRFNKEMKNLLNILTTQIKDNKPVHEIVGKWFTENSFIKFIDKKSKEVKYIEKTCSICLDDFTPDFTPLDPCGHYVHEICIKRSNKNQCPICRVNVKLKGNQESGYNSNYNSSYNSNYNSSYNSGYDYSRNLTEGQKAHDMKRAADPTRPNTGRDYIYKKGSDIPYYFDRVCSNKYNDSFYYVYKSEEGKEINVPSSIFKED